MASAASLTLRSMKSCSVGFRTFGMRSILTCPPRSIAPATQCLFSRQSSPRRLPPTTVSSTSTTPTSVGAGEPVVSHRLTDAQVVIEHR